MPLLSSLEFSLRKPGGGYTYADYGRVGPDGAPEALAPATEEFGHPQWVFGLATYALCQLPSAII